MACGRLTFTFVEIQLVHTDQNRLTTELRSSSCSAWTPFQEVTREQKRLVPTLDPGLASADRRVRHGYGVVRVEPQLRSGRLVVV